MFGKPDKSNYFKYDYVSPMLYLRREQLEALRWNENPVAWKKIFDTIPRNYRKMYMYDDIFEKATGMCGADFKKRLKMCLEELLEVIG